MKKVAELMSPSPLTVYEDVTVQWACQQMAAKRQGSVLVVPRPEGPADQALGPRAPMGILSETDLVKAVVKHPDDFADRKVVELMTPQPVSIGPDEDLEAAAQLMHLFRVRRLPVVRKGRLVGVLSRGQVMEAQRGEFIQTLRQKEDLEEKVGHDPLTKLPNRLLFDENLGREVDRAQRFGTPLSLIMADLDHFKAVNDTHGHPMGDTVLKQTAEVLAGAFRRSDVVARWGGEEFAILLPHTLPADAAVLAEKLRTRMEVTPFGDDKVSLSLTLSAGLASFGGEVSDGEGLVRAADEALYRAKHNGRNRVEK
jgi:diguanylate cyclase (GGDEF)-like protein